MRRRRTPRTPVSELEQWLVSPDPAKQALADEVLAGMGETAKVQYLAELMARERKKGEKRVALHWVLMLFSVQVIGRINQGLLISTLGISPAPNSLNHYLLVMFTGVMAGVVVLGISKTVTLRVITTRLERAAVLRAAALNDLRLLSNLVDALACTDARGSKAVTTAVKSALCRLLPRLTPGDRGLLTDVQWKRLLLSLSQSARRRNPELARAVLHALGNVGYMDAIPQIEKLVKAKAEFPAEIALRETAQNYLMLLKAKQNTTLEADLAVSQSPTNEHLVQSVGRDTTQEETSWQSQNRT